MENLLTKIDPQKLLGKKISYKAEYYFDKNCKNPQYTIVAAFFGKSDIDETYPVLKVAMVDLYDAVKDEKHRDELNKILHQDTQEDMHARYKYCDYLKTVWLEIYNPLMLSYGDDYYRQYRSEYDDVDCRPFSDDDRDYIFTFKDYLSTLTDMQTQFIELFASEEFLGKEYFKQVKQRIKQHFASKISERKKGIEKRQDEINHMKEAIEDLNNVETI